MKSEQWELISSDRVLVCYNEPTRYYNNYLGKETGGTSDELDLSEREFLKQIEGIKKILLKKFDSVETLAVNADARSVMKKIYHYSRDVIVNFVESVEGNANLESYAAGIFDLLEIPYTGNHPMSLGNCLNKARTKMILYSHGINTPRYQIAKCNKVPSKKEFSLNFPCIVKLAREDASIGISEFSVINDYDTLSERLNYLFKSFKQEVIIEEYIEGRELNVAILGGEALPISEICFDGLPDNLPKIITYEAKWAPDSIYYKYTIPKCPAELKSGLKEKIEKMALEAFEALDCRDYARVDIRLNYKNIPYVIEVNPNPDISPDAGFVRSAVAAGISYEQLLFRITNMALKRKLYDTKITN